jgi:predicted PhzF superfamily epimerase YddE/YHI9
LAALHVLRVFTDEEGRWGNPLGVFVEGAEVAEAERLAIAADLGFSETVFIDDAARGALGIFTPAAELAFAGHPLVGTAWLLASLGQAADVLRPPAGEVAVRREGEATFIAADPAFSPPFDAVELDSPAAVDALDGIPADGGEVYAWAWTDEVAGDIRARSFAPAFGIPEDEATGSAVLALAARLGRKITVRQGGGSILEARPLSDGRAEVGGRVALDEVRDYPLSPVS